MATVLTGGALAVIGKTSKIARLLDKLPSRNIMKKRHGGGNGGKDGGDLFRVVDDVELADIKRTDAFRTTPGQFEGKQFVDNLGDAQKLQKKFSDFYGGNQTIVKGRAPRSVLDRASRTPFSDIPNGTAITVPGADLSKIRRIL